MAQREYKELSCRDTREGGCDFLARGETEDEVIVVLSEHACRAHSICEITPETRDRMKAMIKTVWYGARGPSVSEAKWEREPSPSGCRED